MKKASCITGILIISVCAVFGSAAGGTAEELMGRLPAETSFVTAFGGMDAVEKDFNESSLGKIWNDPQTQTFYRSIVDSLTKAVPGKMDPNDLQKIQSARNLLQMCIRKPIAAGAIPSADMEEIVSFFIVLEAGMDKPKYEAAFNDFLDTVQAKTQKKLLGGRMVSVPDDPDARGVYWGWLNTTFVIAFNDKTGRVIGLMSAGNRFSVEKAFSGLDTKGDALFLNWDFQAFLKNVRKMTEAEENADGAAVFTRVIEQLGVDQIRRFSLCGGFDGPNISIESLLDIPSTQHGIFSNLGEVDPQMLCRADGRASQAGAANISFGGIYDKIFSVIQTAVPAEEFGKIQKQIEGFESGIGFSIRADLLASLAGPITAYSIPAYIIPEAPNGGAVLLADLKSAEAFEKSMNSLGQFMAASFPQAVQVQTQTVGDKQSVHIWISPMLSMMQVMPCWMVQGSKAIIASHPSLAAAASGQLAAGSQEDCLCGNDKFKAVQSLYPSPAVTVSYTDTAVQMRQVLTSLQQFWPMLTMGAMQRGIQLPMMLPNLDQHIRDLPPTVKYTTRTASGLKSVYSGPGLDVSTGTVAGGAMGLAILMPALNKTKQVAQRVVSGTNLKSIGNAAVIYANDYDGKFPPNLEVLIQEADLAPKSLESPYPGAEDPDVTDYYYIEGQTDDQPAQSVLAFDNPRLVRDKINVLYIDGHVAAESMEYFKAALKKTLNELNRQMPEDLKYLFEE